MPRRNAAIPLVSGRMRILIFAMRFVPVFTIACAALFPASLAAQAPARSFGLQAASDSFWSLIAHDARLEKVAGDFGFTEGPVWDPQGFLYVSDETYNEVVRLTPDGRRATILRTGDPDGSTFDQHGRLITTASVLRALIAVTPEGSFTTLAATFEGKRFNSPNDVVLGPDGALYFTDPTLDLPKGEQQEIPFQGVYRLGPSGDLTLLTRDFAQPNGLAFSPDGRRLYIDDSARREIRVFDFAEGSISNGRLFGREDGPKGSGVPDGMRVDEKGNLFVTGPGGIWVWDSAGHHIGTILLPEQPANLGWGDADFQTLYITAETSVYRLRTRTRGFVPYAR